MGGLVLSQVQSMDPVGCAVGQEGDFGPDSILHLEPITESSSSRPPNATHNHDSVDYWGRPRPPYLIRKWPSMLLYLTSQTTDDEWQDVLDRIASHPDEVSMQGKNAGMNALHASCVRYPPLTVVQAMVQTNPSIVLQRNFQGETPLHVASYGSSEAVQRYLVQAVPQAAALADQYGDAPLHFAARAGATFHLLRSLLEAAPTVLGHGNDRGVTPFWLLPRSFLETNELQDDVLVDDEDGGGGEEHSYYYRDDWDNLVLFWQASYRATAGGGGNDWYYDWRTIRTDQGLPLPIRKDQFDWVVHAAAATPSCPRQVLRWLCRMFPEMALRRNDQGYTPLLLACQQKEHAEPTWWNPLEDGFRETIHVAEGALPNQHEAQLQRDEVALQSGDAAFLERLFSAHSPEPETDHDNDDQNEPSPISTTNTCVRESVVQLLLEWSPRSALLADARTGRLPLTHALVSGLDWQASIAPLIAAYCRSRDGPVQFSMGRRVFAPTRYRLPVGPISARPPRV